MWYLGFHLEGFSLNSLRLFWILFENKASDLKDTRVKTMGENIRKDKDNF